MPTPQILSKSPASTLRIAVAYAPKTLDPALASDAAGARLLQLTNPALLTTDAAFNPVPLVAGCTQPAPARIVCTLPVNLRFHDGTPLTAAGVSGWFGALQASPRSPFSSQLKGVRIQPEGPRQLAFTLPAPSLTFLHTLTEIPLAPSPTSIVSGTITPGTLPMGGRPGLGRYRLAGADALGNVTLAAQPGSVAPIAPQALQFLYVQDATTRLLKLRQHEVDIIHNDVPPELFAWAQKYAGGHGFRTLAVPSASYSYLGYNFQNELLREPRVREAIARSVDRAAIRKYLLGGLAAPASSLLPPGHPLLWPAPEEQPDSFSVSELLDGDYLGDRTKPRFTLTLLTSTDALSQRVAQVLQQQLGKNGIALKLEPTEWGAFYSRVQRGQFDLVLLSWAGEQQPEFYYNAFHSSQTPPNGLNRGRVNDKTLDGLLNGIHTATTPQTLAQHTLATQKYLAELRPYLPLYRRHHVLLATPQVGNCQLSQDGGYRGLLACVKTP